MDGINNMTHIPKSNAYRAVHDDKAFIDQVVHYCRMQSLSFDVHKPYIQFSEEDKGVIQGEGRVYQFSGLFIPDYRHVQATYGLEYPIQLDSGETISSDDLLRRIFSLNNSLDGSLKRQMIPILGKVSEADKRINLVPERGEFVSSAPVSVEKGHILFAALRETIGKQ